MAGPTQEQLLLAQDNDDALGIPRGTTARQIAAESDWDPTAVSRTGAMGYAQVEPKTLAGVESIVGRKLDPSNYADALTIQRTVMGQNLKRFGNLPDALRAYNAGWDPTTWDNSETNGYVATIMGDTPESTAPVPAKLDPVSQELALSAKEKPALDRASAELLAQPIPDIDTSIDTAAEQESSDQLAKTTHKAGIGESFLDAFNWDTATGGIIDLFKADDEDPNWHLSNEDIEAMGKNNPEVWANEDLRDYVLGATSQTEWERRMKSAQDRAEFFQRYNNTDGWLGDAAGFSHFVGGAADPVTLAATLATGGVVGLARAGLVGAAESAASRSLLGATALAGAENAGIYAGIRSLRNQDVKWGDIATQALVGAAMGALGHTLGARKEGSTHPADTALDGAAKGLDEAVDRMVSGASNDHLAPDIGQGAFLADLPSQTHIPVASDAPKIAALEREREQLTSTQTDPLAEQVAAKKQSQLDLLEDHAPTEADIKPLAKQLQKERRLSYKEALSLATKRVQRAMKEHQERTDNLRQSLEEHQDALTTQKRLSEIDQELDDLRQKNQPQTPPSLVKNPVTAAVQGALRGASDERLPAVEKETAAMPTRAAAAGADSGRGVLQDLAANAKDPVVRALAGRLAEQLKDDVPVKVVKNGKDAGVYDPLKHSVELGSGASEQTKLHELAHAALARKIAFGLANPETEHGSLVADLNQVRRAAQKAYKGSNDTVKYHLSNLQEFAAGLYGGHKELLEHLANTKVSGAPLLSKAVDLIRNLLGFPAQESNALFRALGITDKLGDLDVPAEADMGVLRSPEVRDELRLRAGAKEWLDRAEQYDETPGTEKIAKQRGKLRSWADNPIRKTPGFKLMSKYWTSVGFSLATSKSKLARMIGATVAEDPTGLNRTSSTTAAMDMAAMYDRFSVPMMTVYNKILPKLMTKLQRVDAWFGGGAAVERRIGKEVAEERLKHRAAIKAGREFVSTANPLIHKLAGALDGFWKDIAETGSAAGEKISDAIKGLGYVGHIPYHWDWQALRDAYHNHPGKWNAFKENMRRQYIGKVLQPALDKALEKGPMRPEDIDALRESLMGRVNHLTDNYLGRIIEDPQGRVDGFENHFGQIAQDLLNENWAGTKITPEVAKEFGARLQDIIENRERTEFDLLSEVDGVRMLDYMDTDIGRMIHRNSSNFAGRIALTKVGLGEPKQVAALKEALREDNASAEDIKNVEHVISAMRGELRGKNSIMVRLLRDGAYASFMGMLGLNALADTPMMISAIGVTGMVRAFGRATLREDSGLMRFLHEHAGSTLGLEHKLHSRRTPESSVKADSVFSEGSRMMRLAGNAKDMVGTVSLLNAVSRMQHRAFTPFIAEEIFNTVKTGRGLTPERLADMGILPKDVEIVRTQIMKHDAGRKKGEWINLDDWDDPYAADMFVQAIHRTVGQVLQRAHVGETARWTSESALGQLMSQFRNFGITAAGKQLIRNLAIGDAQAYATLVIAPVFGALLYYARVQANSLNMSPAKKQKYLEENLSGWRLATGIAVMTNMSGILPETIDAAHLFFGGTTYSPSAPVAAAGFLENLAKGLNAAGTSIYGAATGHKPGSVDPVNYHKELRKMMRVLPGSNTIFGTALANSLNEDQ